MGAKKSTSFSTWSPPVRLFLPLISALTGFHNWGLAARWVQLATTFTISCLAHRKIKVLSLSSLSVSLSPSLCLNQEIRMKLLLCVFRGGSKKDQNTVTSGLKVQLGQKILHESDFSAIFVHFPGSISDQNSWIKECCLAIQDWFNSGKRGSWNYFVHASFLNILTLKQSKTSWLKNKTILTPFW